MISFCRRIGFYLLDGIRGGAVKHVSEIPALYSVKHKYIVNKLLEG